MTCYCQRSLIKQCKCADILITYDGQYHQLPTSLALLVLRSVIGLSCRSRTRLLSWATFNVHITVVSLREMAMYTGVCMRVLRRIGRCMRFGETISDCEVGRRMGQPSIDRLVVRRRLLHLRRLLVHRPRTLLCLCSQRPGGVMVSWTKAVVDDMCLQRDRVESVGRLGVGRPPRGPQ